MNEARDISGEEALATSATSIFEKGFISPCLDVLPMGWSCFFKLVQSLHVQGCLESSGYHSNSIILDSRPPPQLDVGSSLSMPYCDNTHMLSMHPDLAHSDHVNLKKNLEDWGFSMHEEQGPTTFFPTLGGIIDGKQGMIKPNTERYWNIIMAFDYVCNHPVLSEVIQKLLGHAMVLLVLNRQAWGFSGASTILQARTANARCCGAVQFGSARFFLDYSTISSRYEEALEFRSLLQ